MAIEFLCPSCSAAIRVADQFGGRVGTCPQCRTRLLVPAVAPAPELRDRATARGSAADTDVSAAVSGAAAVPDPSQPRPVSAEGVTGAVPPEISEVPPFALPAPAGTVTRRRNRRQQSRRRILVLGVPAVCFLALLGVLASVMMNQMPQLTGQLPATRVAGTDLPEFRVPWSGSGLAADAQQTLRTVLEAHPEAFISELLVCRFHADASGLTVKLTSGGSQAWFLVDPAHEKALVAWQRLHQQELAVQRTKELQDSLREYASDKDRAAAGADVVLEAQKYRDQIGLNAGTGGLGYVLEAAVPGRVVRCAGEDTQGRLYFLLPAETQSFTLRGRSLSNGTRPFPGEYQVQVAAGETVIVAPAADEGASETEAETSAEDEMSAGDSESLPPADSGSGTEPDMDDAAGDLPEHSRSMKPKAN